MLWNLRRLAEHVLTEVVSENGLRAFSAAVTLREWKKGTLSFP
jgi:hypothetical protein